MMVRLSIRKKFLSTKLHGQSSKKRTHKTSLLNTDVFLSPHPYTCKGNPFPDKAGISMLEIASGQGFDVPRRTANRGLRLYCTMPSLSSNKEPLLVATDIVPKYALNSHSYKRSLGLRYNVYRKKEFDGDCYIIQARNSQRSLTSFHSMHESQLQRVNGIRCSETRCAKGDLVCFLIRARLESLCFATFNSPDTLFVATLQRSGCHACVPFQLEPGLGAL
jgi:hypothetical protein